MYFEDKDYDKFLADIEVLTLDKELFRKVYCKVNNIKGD